MKKFGRINRWISGKPKPPRTIGDMRAGETGWAVPWAADDRTGTLCLWFSIGRKGGTAQLWVKCIVPGEEYEVNLERPVSSYGGGANGH